MPSREVNVRKTAGTVLQLKECFCFTGCCCRKCSALLASLMVQIGVVHTHSSETVCSDFGNWPL